MMSDSFKKALFYFGSGFVLFWIFKPTPRKSLSPGVTEIKELDPKERTRINKPTITKSDARLNPLANKAFKALCAYIDAYNAKEPQEKLDELNDEIAKMYNVTVYRRRQDNKLAVRDLTGKDILVSNA